MRVRQILVPIDFSATSKEALELARMLADAFGASIHLLTVVGSPLAAPADVEQERRDACALLNTLVRPADRTQRHATVSCEVGTPAHEIARYAAGHGVDLIVMGTHSHGPTFRMATGSVAETVLGTAPCAVLAVKGAGSGTFEAVFDPPAAEARG